MNCDMFSSKSGPENPAHCQIPEKWWQEGMIFEEKRCQTKEYREQTIDSSTSTLSTLTGIGSAGFQMGLGQAHLEIPGTDA